MKKFYVNNIIIILIILCMLCPDGFPLAPAYPGRELSAIIAAHTIAERLFNNEPLGNIVWAGITADIAHVDFTLTPEIFFNVQAALRGRFQEPNDARRYALERKLLLSILFTYTPNLDGILQEKLEGLSPRYTGGGTGIDLIYADQFIILNSDILRGLPEFVKMIETLSGHAVVIEREIRQYSKGGKGIEPNSCINVCGMFIAIQNILSEFDISDNFHEPHKITARLLSYTSKEFKMWSLQKLLKYLKTYLARHIETGITGLEDITREAAGAVDSNDLGGFYNGPLGQALVEFFRHIPKADLHHHLDGCISPKVALRVLWQYPGLRHAFVSDIMGEKEGNAEEIFMRQIGGLHDPQSPERLKSYIEFHPEAEGEIDWDRYYEKFKLFDYIFSAGTDAVRFCSRESSLEDFRRDNVTLIEHRIPIVLSGVSLSSSEMLESAITGLIEAERASGGRLKTGLIPCLWKEPQFILGKKYRQALTKAELETRSLKEIKTEILDELPADEKEEFLEIAGRIKDKKELVILYEARQEALRQIQLVVDLKRRLARERPLYAEYLLGIDTLGDESEYTRFILHPALKYASSKGFNITEHLGENWKPGELRTALLRIKRSIESDFIERISQPVALGIEPSRLRGASYTEREIEEIGRLQQEILTLIKNKGITIEMSPSSTLLLAPERHLGLIEGLHGHPFVEFHKAGVNVSLGANNRVVQHIGTLSEELARIWLSNPGLTFHDIEKVIGNGFRSSFIDTEKRREAPAGISKGPEIRFKGSTNDIGSIITGTIVREDKVSDVNITFYCLARPGDTQEEIDLKIRQEQERFENDMETLLNAYRENNIIFPFLQELIRRVKQKISETRMNAEFVFLQVTESLIKELEKSDDNDSILKADFLRKHMADIEKQFQDEYRLKDEEVQEEINNFKAKTLFFLLSFARKGRKTERKLSHLLSLLKELLGKNKIHIENLITKAAAKSNLFAKYSRKIIAEFIDIDNTSAPVPLPETAEQCENMLTEIFKAYEQLDILESFGITVTQMRERTIDEIGKKHLRAIAILRDRCRYFRKKLSAYGQTHARKAFEDSLLIYLDVAQHLQKEMRIAAKSETDMIILMEIDGFSAVLEKVTAEGNSEDTDEKATLIEKLRADVPRIIRKNRCTAGRAVFDVIDKEFPSPDKPEFVVKLMEDILSELERDDLSSESIILVYKDPKQLQPAEFVRIMNKYGHRLKCVICEGGSGASHFGTLAAGEGIIFIGGMKGIYEAVTGEEEVMIDGSTGELVIHPSTETANTMLTWALRKQIFDNYCSSNIHQPAATIDGTNITILANADTEDQIKSAKRKGVSGIGLVRTEYLYARDTMPSEDELARIFGSFANAADDYVTIRLFDRQKDKEMPCVKGDDDIFGFDFYFNSKKGLEAVTTEIRAAMIAAEKTAVKENGAPAKIKIKILFPQVSTAEDADKATTLIDEIKTALITEGRITKDTADSIETGFMIETPVAVLNINSLLEKCDFISLGTNDLTETAFGKERDDPHALVYFKNLQPAILRLIAQVTEAVKRHNLAHPSRPKQVSVCGELAHLFEFIPFAVALNKSGSRVNLSMAVRHIPKVKEFILHIDSGEIETKCGLNEGALAGTDMPPEDIHIRANRYMREIVGRIKATKMYKRLYTKGMLSPKGADLLALETFWRRKSASQWKNNMREALDALLGIIYSVELEEGDDKFLRIVRALETEYTASGGIKKILIAMLLAELHRDTKDLIVMDCMQFNTGMIPLLKKIPNLVILGDIPEAQNAGLKIAADTGRVKQLAAEMKVERTIFILGKTSKDKFFAGKDFGREYDIEGVGRSFIMSGQISRDMTIMQLLCIAQDVFAADFSPDRMPRELADAIGSEDLLSLRSAPAYKPEQLSLAIDAAKCGLEEIIRSS